MNNRERGERIRRQILRDAKHHPGDISKHIGTIFPISPQAVNSHIKRLENEGWLASSGIGKGKRYFLGDLRKHHSCLPFTGDLAEDQIWRSHYSFMFEDLPENTGTLVYMSIQREADRNLQDVFDRFTAGPDEFQFN